MCRHLAYVGSPIPLAALLLAPAHGLLRQSWAPRQQRHGVVNADGFGVGWYAEGDPRPARYRRAVPIWADQSFADVARVTYSGAVLAAVRSATTGQSQDESAAAPYTDGRWLFSHNGRIDGWPTSVAPLAARLPAYRLLDLEARVDSALIWALVQQRLAEGDGPEAAVAAVIAEVRGVTDARLNLLLTDGRSIVATAVGDTLCWRHDDEGGTVIASEPYDDDPRWHVVPDDSLVVATRDRVDVVALTEAPPIIPAKESVAP